MSRRVFLPLALRVVLLGAGPVLADANGSTEQKQVPRSCGAPADTQYSAPGPEDCKDAEGNFDPSAEYTATYYSNDVECGSEDALTPDTPTGVTVYGSGDPAAQNGRVATCSEGGSLPVAAPVQGRASFEGSPATGPRLVVDGDKDNPQPNGNATATGFVVVEAAPAAAPPSVRCGDEHAQGGRADSDSVQDRDQQGECQG